MKGRNVPNILFIMCDQLCASVLDVYGGTVETRNIGKLAERGATFNSAYCPTPFCTPSRASILTGLYPHRHGLVSNVMRLDYPAIGGPEDEEGIDERDVTTEGILHGKGYKTIHSGKWHLSGSDLPCYDSMYREHQEYGVEMRGVFDRAERLPRDSYMDWYGWKMPVTLDPDYVACLGALPEWLRNAPTFGDFYTKIGRLDLPPEDTFDYKTASRGVDAIMHAEEPFMLTCSFNTPHDPNVVPSPYYESIDVSGIKADASLPCDAAYLKELSKVAPMHAGDAFLREFLRVYYASVKLVDEQVGRLLEALKKRGIYENTIIIFTTDHGDMAGGHGMFWKSTKAFYEEIARVPLIISAPGCGKNIRYNKPVELVDIMPTILELCGARKPENIDGESLVPALSGGELRKKVAVSERLPHQSPKRHAHTSDNIYHFMLRSEQYKYIIHHEKDSETRILFNLNSDPNEYENLAGAQEYTEIEHELRSLLRTRLAESEYILK